MYFVRNAADDFWLVIQQRYNTHTHRRKVKWKEKKKDASSYVFKNQIQFSVFYQKLKS